MECFRLLFDHLAWIEWHKRFKARGLWGIMKRVGGARKSIHQSWLAKGLGLGLLCWGFKGVQEEIRSEEASTLQIGSMAFPAGQCSSPQLHPCHRLFDQRGTKTVPHPPYSLDLVPCDFCLFPKLKGWQLRRCKRLCRGSLTRSQRRTSMGYSRSCWNHTASALQPVEIISKRTSVSCVYYK